MSVFLAALLVITAIGAAARLYQLDRPSFWGDELRTIGAAATPVNEYHRSPRAIGQVPTALGLWLSGVQMGEVSRDQPHKWRSQGINEWNARIGSAIVGILTIPIVIVAARRMLGAPASLLAGLLLALAPWHIVWSQAARFYTLQFLFYTLCLIWYYQWRNERSGRILVAAVAALILAFLSQPTALLALGVIAADLILGLIRRDITLMRREATMIASGGGVCLALLAYYVSINPETWLKFIAFAGRTPYHQPATLVAGALYMVQLPVVAVAALSAAWLLGRDRRLAMFLLLGVAVPLAALATWSSWNFVGVRYTLVVLWPFLALASLGLISLYRAMAEARAKALALAPAALAIMALFLPLYSYYEDGYGYRGRWREAFDYALEHRRAGEKIATTGNQLHVAQYYCGEEDIRQMNWTLGDMIDNFASTTWLVFHAETSVRGRAQEWALESAELRAVFDLRVPQPIEKVAVYRFVPETAEMRKRALTGTELSDRGQ